MINSAQIYKKILGNKKVEIIEFLASSSDKNGFINLTIDEICKFTNSSKPTVIDTIAILKQKGIIKRIKNGVYKLTL